MLGGGSDKRAGRFFSHAAFHVRRFRLKGKSIKKKRTTNLQSSLMNITKGALNEEGHHWGKEKKVAKN